MREEEIGVSTRPFPKFPQQDSRYEYLCITVNPRENIHAVRARVMEHTEYGRWELARTVILYGGKRRIWLRRRILKVQNTIALMD